MSKTKSILANMQFVKNVRAGSQTQHRTPLKVQPLLLPNATQWTLGWDQPSDTMFLSDEHGNVSPLPKLKRQPGDILGLRERARLLYIDDDEHWLSNADGSDEQKGKFRYEADMSYSELIPYPSRLAPMQLGHCVPNGCFKELIRTFIKVKRVWVERGCDISHLDVKAEGIEGISMGHRRERYKDLIESIYPNSWEKWFECCEFELIDKPEGESK